ncbi:hypothetical protein [Lysinibacillus sp. NPDC056232]|uniref:hypothetical protein n=1 Tax=Lysinibacillus sp. NPDC056232 TaxID=3345756 RepID=UPI0035E162D4
MHKQYEARILFNKGDSRFFCFYGKAESPSCGKKNSSGGKKGQGDRKKSERRKEKLERRKKC